MWTVKDKKIFFLVSGFKMDKFQAYSFSRNIGLKSKQERVIYSCDQCDYVVTGVQCLKLSIESKHEGVSFLCY